MSHVSQQAIEEVNKMRSLTSHAPYSCHVRKLAMMQSSKYSVYNEMYKEQLEYVYAKCGLQGPTAIPESVEIVQPQEPPFCLSGKRYKTKVGDSCESIANSTSVSGAALYMGNQDLITDCSDIQAGLSICLPLTCITHHLQPSDTCFSVERSRGIGFGMLQRYNSWIDSACTNLQTGTGFYGKTICVSPQGGESVNPPTPPVVDGSPKTSDGYTRVKTPPPVGATVAKGTTMICGKWHLVSQDDSCVKICLTNGIDTTLFHQVNPSLAAGEDCTSSLKVGTALCTGPNYEWRNPAQVPSPTESQIPDQTSSQIVSQTASQTTSPTISQDGTCGGLQGYICTGYMDGECCSA